MNEAGVDVCRDSFLMSFHDVAPTLRMGLVDRITSCLPLRQLPVSSSLLAIR